MKRLDIQAFAAITRRVIAKNGFAAYMPTLCLPTRERIVVLEGIPKKESGRMREIATSWAERMATQNEDYFLAYKEDSRRFRVVHRHRGRTQEECFAAKPSSSVAVGIARRRPGLPERDRSA